MSIAASLAVLLPLLAPPATPPTDAEKPEPSATPTQPAVDDYAVQAPLDVQTLLTDTSRAYLDARARLEAHPTLAAEAILDRLSAVPPPISTDRKRLLDVLAALGLPDHVPLFAEQLRRAILRDDSQSAQGKAIGRWLPLLVEQGEAAVGPLTGLVADKELPLSARAPLLDALVEVTPADDLPRLAALVGRGARPLRQQLHRSLSRRVKDDPQSGARLLVALDEARAEAEPQRLPALLALRAAVTPSDDTDFATQLDALARDDAGSFAVQISAVHALAALDTAAAQRSLAAVADSALQPERLATQRGELLAWAALSGLPEPEVRARAQAHALSQSGAPRLAVLGMTFAPLSTDQAWLPAALDNPWPQVRKAALARVQGPCPSASGRLLEQKAHLAGKKSEDDRAVARAAITALGRCKASDRLATLLADEQLDVELRGEAARQLARLGDDDSIQAIGRVLRRHPDRMLARRLASALRHMPKATAAGDAVLCEAAGRGDEAGQAARDSLAKLHDDLDGVCE